MSPKFLLQTAALLFLGQLLLGLLGRLLVGATPWPGLPVTLFLVWFIYRTAIVLREEMGRALKRGEPVQPGRLAFFVALAAQAPGLALLSFDWALLLWQGAAVPVAGTIGVIWPEMLESVRAWLWLAALAEVALFTWVAGAPERKAPAPSAAPAKARAGEWQPARRVTDVQRRGRRVR